MPEGITENVQKLVETVEQLTVIELSELVKALEDRFGVEPVVFRKRPQFRWHQPHRRGRNL